MHLIGITYQISQLLVFLTNLPAPTRNLQNCEDKDVDQPAKPRATPYRTHVLLLFYHRGWKQNSSSNMYVHARCFVQFCREHCVIKVFILWS